jgi:hypothetical protein
VFNSNVAERQSDTGTQVSSSSAIEQLDVIDTLLRGLDASWNDSASFERRSWHRVSYSVPLTIAPLDPSTGEIVAEAMPAAGRTLSLGGLSFNHKLPIPNVHVVVTLLDASGLPERVVMQLRWCRFTRCGQYESGGRFLRRYKPAASA